MKPKCLELNTRLGSSTNITNVKIRKHDKIDIAISIYKKISKMEKEWLNSERKDNYL